MAAIPFSEAVSERPAGAYQLLVLVLVAAALVFDGIDLQVLPLVSPAIVGE